MEFKHDITNSCAFHVENKNAVCSPVHVVEKLKDFINKTTPTKKFGDDAAGRANILNEGHNKDGGDENVIEILKKKYKCNSEACVLKQPDISTYVNPGIVEDTLRHNFKPSGPRQTKEWLSNFDIDDVLRQIQKKYANKHFLHIPFQMRDFEKTGGELSRLNWIKKYELGFRTFGTVVNTDYSHGNGIHWFALFGDFLDDSDTFTIEYFNSSGELPLDEIMVWMKRLKHECANYFTKPVKDVIVTRLVNQRDDNSCGPYSLYYIISRLDDVPFKYFKNNRIGDRNMQLFRQYIFRDEN